MIKMDIINEEIEWKIEQIKKFYLKTPQCRFKLSEEDKIPFKLEGWLDALEWVLRISKRKY